MRLAGAKQLFTSLRDKFLILSDHVQVHPDHSAGSAGGKALGAIPSPTVGYERLYSWWGPHLARACAVIDDPMEIDSLERNNKFGWGLRNRRLSFEAPGFFVFIGESKADLQAEIRQGQPALGVSTFVERAARSELEEVTLHCDKDVLIVRNEDGAINRDRLTGVAAQFTSRTDVTQAVVRSATGRVAVDFEASSGTGHTRSNILMADLLVTSLPLLRSLPDGLEPELKGFLTYEVESEDLTTVVLFDDELDSAD